MTAANLDAPGHALDEDDRPSALSGIRAVVLEGMGPTPFIAMLLADMGAEVVRVTRPAQHAGREIGQTKGLPPHRDVVNRHTMSVEANLKSPDGVDDVLRLMEVADVFIEGLRPGVVERLGIGPEVALGRNPALVYARVTGYGQSGPLAGSVGHDINYVARSGVLHALGHPGEKPRTPINLLGDFAGGGAIGAFGIVSALVAAQRTGCGQVVDVAMVDGTALLSSRMQGLRAAGLFSDVPGTNHIDSGAPFYDTYETADGRCIAVGALEDDFYAAFLDGLSTDTSAWPDRHDPDGWPRLRECIASVIRTRTMDEWTERFAGTDGCVSPVLTFDEAAVDPHNAARDVFVDVDGVLQPAPSPRLSRTPSRRPGYSMTDETDVTTLAARWGSIPKKQEQRCSQHTNSNSRV